VTSTVAQRIFIVEDHPIIRRGYRSLLDAEPNLQVVGEADTAEEALAYIDAAEPPDLVVVDLGLDGMSGLELIKRLTSSHAGIRILVISMYEETLYGERALQAGAHGYVRKKEANTVIVDAIQDVLDGNYYLSEDLQRRVLRRYTGQKRQGETGLERLTDRELDVFERIGRGLSTREIAEELHISIKTVQTHRSNIQEKFGSDTVEKLMRRAVLWTIRRSK
jgi:DNA-binding NarL/FixJ family response regulator